MALAVTLPPQPRPDFAWIGTDGRPSLEFAQYLLQVDAAVRLLASGQVGTLKVVATPTNANAATAGVPIGGIYTASANPAQVFVRTA